MIFTELSYEVRSTYISSEKSLCRLIRVFYQSQVCGRKCSPAFSSRCIVKVRGRVDIPYHAANGSEIIKETVDFGISGFGRLIKEQRRRIGYDNLFYLSFIYCIYLIRDSHELHV